MDTLIYEGVNLMDTKIKKTIIPDNDYLPFVPVRDTLLAMEVGDITEWPKRKGNSLKQTIVKLNREYNRVYRVNCNRQTISVCRFADKKENSNAAKANHKSQVI